MELVPSHPMFKIEVFNAPSNTIWPFKIYLSQNNPSKCNPRLKNEDVTWSPQYNLPTTRTNKRRALSLREVELDGWFLVFHIVLETCSISFLHKFNMSFVLHFYILRLTSWIWTSLSTEELKCESPSKCNSYEDFNLEHWSHRIASPRRSSPGIASPRILAHCIARKVPLLLWAQCRREMTKSKCSSSDLQLKAAGWLATSALS